MVKSEIIRKEKTGVVLIPSPQGDLGQHELVESAKFSNFDFQLYTENGEIHPLLENNIGRPFALGFKLNCEDRHGKSVSFEGKLKLPLTLGDTRSRTPDEESIRQALELMKQVANQAGLVSGDDDPRLQDMEDYEVAKLMCFISPKRKIENGNLLLYLIPSVFAADIFTKADSSGVKDRPVLPYGTLLDTHCVLMNVLQGTGDTSLSLRKKMQSLQVLRGNNISVKKSLELWNMYKGSSYVFSVLREKMLKLEDGESEIEPFVQSLNDVLEAMLLDSCKEWINRDENEGPAEVETQQSLFEFSKGGPSFIEAIALQNQIKVKSVIRNSFLFRRFRQLACLQMGKLYDLFSYKKDVGNKNQVWVLHNRNNLRLEECLKKVLDDVNKYLEEMMKVGDLLLELHSSDSHLKEYVQIVKDVVCGYIKWSGYSSLFHSKLVFNCYID